MVNTLNSQSRTVRPAAPRRVCTWLVALILGAACFIVAPGLRARESARDARAVAAEHVLPQACVSLLEERQCWLRSVGNDEARVAQAVGDERASYERWHESADACQNEAEYESYAFAEVGCARGEDGARALPAAARVDCPEGTFFFTRQDGHVSGCRQTCTVAEDCDDGSTCSSVGSAARGPVLETFCE
jgi:hypothetical protein